MTTKFDAAFDYLIDNEGGLADLKNDKGGLTKFGISERFIEGLNPNNVLPVIEPQRLNMPKSEIFVDGYTVKQYIKSLDINLARLIYYRYFWLPIYKNIENQYFCNQMLDMSVHHGHHNAAELIQRAINACVERRRLTVDGSFGHETLKLLNLIIGYEGNSAMLRKCLIAVRESKFRCIVAIDPLQKDKLNGWLNRTYGEKL